MLSILGCTSQLNDGNVMGETAAVTLTTQPLNTSTCSQTFVAHNLDHVTMPLAQPVTMFDSNGAGLAINDLDNDGDLDIVLANLKEPNTLLWNEGELRFRSERLGVGRARAVNSVDVDADGWLDLVFTIDGGGVNYWHNTEGRFAQAILPNIRKHAYAMTWGDVDADGDLDFVTGSYDAALEKMLGNSFMLSDGAGVFFHENENGQFTSTRLADNAQALAIYLIDINKDGRLDILIGNDFVTRDQVWLQTADGWQAAAPFSNTTHSTMSFDAADIDNNGTAELFATDMHPYDNSPEVLAKWQPVMDMMMHGELVDDPQIMENVLQKSNGQRYQNIAADSGLAFTGWSWSAKFGDLDNDGLQDVYVVNGMMAAELFSHLPNNELVEENQAFRNIGQGQFAPAPNWGLGSTLSGRGMSMADLDTDGDLDIVVNNLLSPAQIFENQLCGGDAAEFDLRQANGANPFAIGAKVTLTTNQGVLTRDVRVSSGYLSGDPTRLHFGLPPGAAVSAAEITWPDGAKSILPAITPNTLTQVVRP